MNVEIKFPCYDSAGRVFLTWRPVKVAVRLIDAPVGQAAVPVRLTSNSKPGACGLAFADRLTDSGTDSIDLTLAADGTPTDVWIGGKFNPPDTQSPSPASLEYGDIVVEAREIAGGAAAGPLLGSHKTMVRVRKDGETLSDLERENFISALAALNGRGQGIFTQFRQVHVDGLADEQAHGGAGFLPWHRAYLLDLERELQNIDPTVSLPYWRFDRTAPRLISRQFMGIPKDDGTVSLRSGHPFVNWSTDEQVGIFRGPGVMPDTLPRPNFDGFDVLTEHDTLALSSGPNARFTRFAAMQGTPHGAAHVSHWSGPITEIPNAARDPLFFLLHCNVDRLWAKWQWLNNRQDPALQSSFGGPPSPITGHNLNDTLWPWDGDTVAPRPGYPPPRAGLAPSPMTTAPGPAPRLRDMIDYLAVHGGIDLGFAYDDVPFEV